MGARSRVVACRGLEGSWGRTLRACGPGWRACRNSKKRSDVRYAGSSHERLGHLRYKRLNRKCRSRTVGRCRHRPLWSGLPVLCHCSPGTVPTSCTTSTAHTRPNVACPHHIYHTGTVTPSVFSQSTSGAVRYRQLLRDGLLHAGHTPHIKGSEVSTNKRIKATGDTRERM